MFSKQENVLDLQRRKKKEYVGWLLTQVDMNVLIFSCELEIIEHCAVFIAGKMMTNCFFVSKCIPEKRTSIIFRLILKWIEFVNYPLFK